VLWSLRPVDKPQGARCALDALDAADLREDRDAPSLERLPDAERDGFVLDAKRPWADLQQMDAGPERREDRGELAACRGPADDRNGAWQPRHRPDVTVGEREVAAGE
jgi:hypothetical protein